MLFPPSLLTSYTCQILIGGVCFGFAFCFTLLTVIPAYPHGGGSIFTAATSLLVRRR